MDKPWYRLPVGFLALVNHRLMAWVAESGGSTFLFGEPMHHPLQPNDGFEINNHIPISSLAIKIFKVVNKLLKLIRVFELLGRSTARVPIPCAHPAAHVLNVVPHQGREAVMQAQHQTNPLICARGNGAGSLAGIKE
ncbi:MAG: hypothetical protein TQ37_02945 [Candidatus Synechococcus spongiarum 15L]|uniref:Uncharacterized protein n=1 Tax=Candidatus Synechococcus spongiarum 15L TaxID=1608419 RepID=A0A0G8AXI6_9SYNE|nr:MAG: hypothetical protein TQ37_02945 [Candidatus Synechococcus spongiarum 15L]